MKKMILASVLAGLLCSTNTMALTLSESAEVKDKSWIEVVVSRFLPKPRPTRP